jgi:hypothetical protein
MCVFPLHIILIYKLPTLTIPYVDELMTTSPRPHCAWFVWRCVRSRTATCFAGHLHPQNFRFADDRLFGGNKMKHVRGPRVLKEFSCKVNLFRTPVSSHFLVLEKPTSFCSVPSIPAETHRRPLSSRRKASRFLVMHGKDMERWCIGNRNPITSPKSQYMGCVNHPQILGLLLGFEHIHVTNDRTNMD